MLPAAGAGAGADGFIASTTATVKRELPQRLAHLHGQAPGSVAIFHSMLTGSDELAQGLFLGEGTLASARHVLERGNEILRDFANKTSEEFRMSMAYQKFEERSNQMRHVLRCVLQSNGSDGIAAGHSEGEHRGDERGLEPESLGQGSAATAPLRVLSLGGGSGNDAVGVISFLMERNALCGVTPSVVAVPRKAVEPQGSTKLTWAEKKAAKKAGIDLKTLQAEPTDFRFANDMLRLRGAVKAPEHSWFPACPSVQCHVLDIDAQWYESVGACVQRATQQYFGGVAAGTSAGATVPFAEMHWHQCDVTEPLCDSYARLRAAPRLDPSHPAIEAESEAAAKAAPALHAAGVALVVTSYLFTKHTGLPAGHTGRLAPETAIDTDTGELTVSTEFWGKLLAQNPTSWCVFVEGWVSRKTWGALFEVFAQAGRVLSSPQKVTGELPQRVVIPSKRRPHAIRERDRTYCYWFSPPPAGAALSQEPEPEPEPGDSTGCTVSK